jgi:protein O-mannosyl-transferase
VSPKHTKINDLRTTLLEMGISPEDKADRLRQLAESNPTADNYLNLSLALYNIHDFEGCIRACEQALIINPDYALAYNNMCSAYSQLKQWELAVEACENALQITPNFERAQNNLTWARSKL